MVVLRKLYWRITYALNDLRVWYLMLGCCHHCGLKTKKHAKDMCNTCFTSRERRARFIRSDYYRSGEYRKNGFGVQSNDGN